MKYTYNYQNPEHVFNSSKYHTGKDCINSRCEKPAGTKWSPFWCQPCNAKRMDRITKQLEDIIEERFKPLRINLPPRQPKY